MSVDKRPDRHRSVGWEWSRIIRVFSVAVVLYVLSVGPVLKVERTDSAKLTTLRTVYRPLLALARSSFVFATFYEWYVYHVWKVQI